jgi:type I restriction enzyme M protein
LIHSVESNPQGQQWQTIKILKQHFLTLLISLEKDEYSDPEDRDEYIAGNIFFVPKDARWGSLQAKAKLPEIGVAIDDAMNIIEKENTELKHVLPKVYAKPNLDKSALGQL